jgi:hypothetical protein
MDRMRCLFCFSRDLGWRIGEVEVYISGISRRVLE